MCEDGDVGGVCPQTVLKKIYVVSLRGSSVRDQSLVDDLGIRIPSDGVDTDLGRSLGLVCLRCTDDLRRIMMTIVESDGRIVINCQLGKDRTGMVIAMLQALTGSTYDQIKAEYLQSFVNLYGIDVGSEEYETLGRMMFDRLFYVFAHPELSDMAGSVDWSVLDGYQFDMEQITLNFLKNYANMTDAEIDRLIDRLSQ